MLLLMSLHCHLKLVGNNVHHSFFEDVLINVVNVYTFHFADQHVLFNPVPLQLFNFNGEAF